LFCFLALFCDPLVLCNVFDLVGGQGCERRRGRLMLVLLVLLIE
jgi:hypothetical protein